MEESLPLLPNTSTNEQAEVSVRIPNESIMFDLKARGQHLDIKLDKLRRQSDRASLPMAQWLAPLQRCIASIHHRQGRDSTTKGPSRALQSPPSTSTCPASDTNLVDESVRARHGSSYGWDPGPPVWDPGIYTSMGTNKEDDNHKSFFVQAVAKNNNSSTNNHNNNNSGSNTPINVEVTNTTHQHYEVSYVHHPSRKFITDNKVTAEKDVTSISHQPKARDIVMRNCTHRMGFNKIKGKFRDLTGRACGLLSLHFVTPAYQVIYPTGM
jgi:hypothetical protein